MDGDLFGKVGCPSVGCKCGVGGEGSEAPPQWGYGGRAPGTFSKFCVNASFGIFCACVSV